ncbi:MAG: hypothetical protein K0R48_1394, partial [Gammaproteobacteria bacterium]|nr:hypothetical protein [Gammaproteobacteria bacterium]
MMKAITNLVSKRLIKGLLRNVSVALLVAMAFLLSGCDADSGALAPRGPI